LAGMYLQRGELAPAESESRAALAINPGNAAAWLHLSQCALGGNRANEAIWTSMESLKLNPAGSQAFEVLLAACKNLGPQAGLKSVEAAAGRAPFAAEVTKAMLLLEMENALAAADALTSAATLTT